MNTDDDEDDEDEFQAEAATEMKVLFSDVYMYLNDWSTRGSRLVSLMLSFAAVLIFKYRYQTSAPSWGQS